MELAMVHRRKTGVVDVKTEVAQHAEVDLRFPDTVWPRARPTPYFAPA